MQKKSPIFFPFPSESTFDRRSKVELKEKKRRIVERRQKKRKIKEKMFRGAKMSLNTMAERQYFNDYCCKNVFFLLKRLSYEIYVVPLH